MVETMTCGIKMEDVQLFRRLLFRYNGVLGMRHLFVDVAAS